jgi:short-subunit dehydrogenase
MNGSDRPLAVVTGAASGIGFELACQCANNGFDLVLAADDPKIKEVAERLRFSNRSVEALKVNLCTVRGVDRLYEHIGGRAVDALIANTGRGVGGVFLEQDLKDIRRVFDANITGIVYLVQKFARDMRARGTGRILITGANAGFRAGACNAVYSGAKAFLDSFASAIRNELSTSGVRVTCLTPSEDGLFERSSPLFDTKAGWAKLDHVADFAKTGFEAMMANDDAPGRGLHSKIQAALANIAPAERLAEIYASRSGPGSVEP